MSQMSARLLNILTIVVQTMFIETRIKKVLIICCETTSLPHQVSFNYNTQPKIDFYTAADMKVPDPNVENLCEVSKVISN